MPLELSATIRDPGGDVVADQAHAFDAVDAAFGGFVGVPALETGAGDRVDVSFSPQGDDDVDDAHLLRVNEFGRLLRYVDPNLVERLRG